MISKGCLTRSRRYPQDIYLVISDPWTERATGAILVEVMAVAPMKRQYDDTVYVGDLEVISGV